MKEDKMSNRYDSMVMDKKWLNDSHSLFIDLGTASKKKKRKLRDFDPIGR